MSYKEHLFEQLNKQLTFYVKVLKYTLLPVTVIVAAIGIWWGIDISQARSEINGFRDELDSRIKSAQLASKEFELSNREVDILQVVFKEKVDSMKQELDIIIEKYENLSKENEAALTKSTELYKSLLKNNKDLTGISIEVNAMVTNARIDITEVKDKYHNEIELAQKGVDERIEMSIELQNKMQAQYNTLVMASLILAEIIKLDQKIPIMVTGNSNVAGIRQQQQRKFQELIRVLNIK